MNVTKRYLSSVHLIYVLILTISIRETHQQIEVKGSANTEDDESAGGTISSPGNSIHLSSPKELADDDDSIVFPKSVRCDGCLTLAFQIIEVLDKAHSQKKSVKVLPETDVIDILDNLCNSKFENVGLKNVDGVTILSGPGLDSYDKQGLLMSGGRWPQRMKYLCGNVIGEFGEETIYDYYLFQRDRLGDILCRGTGVANSCSPKQSNLNRSNKSKKDEF